MKQVKLNLGCGAYIIHEKGWVNVDGFYEPPKGTKDFVKGDLRDLPFKNNSVDYIVCDQVLEHIPMADVPMVFYEIRRVLKVGGRCVIVVPDFRGSVKQWLDIDHDKSFNPFFYQYLSEVIYGNQIHEGEYHKTPFSAGYMNYALNMVGLTKHELIYHPAFGEVPNYPGIAGRHPNAKLRNPQLVADIIKTK